MNNNILVIDDEESIRWILKKGLQKKGYNVELASNGKEGLKFLTASGEYLAAFIDILLPDLGGIEVLRDVRSKKKSTPMIVMTAQSTMKNAIDAMREGAYDYITKPFDMEEIYLIIEKIVEIHRRERRIALLEEELKTRPGPDELIGSSRGMREVFKMIGKVAATDLTVLVTGESGTGKELVARAIHKNSTRSSGPFVAVNCAAIPGDLLESELFGHERGAFTGAVDSRKGKFELADEGTMFLDEIGDMDIGLQVKMLRVIQEREFYRVGGKKPVKVDIRLIAATNQDLDKAVSKKEFREDLYHRLNVFTVKIPPLRGRVEDIPKLASYFIKKYGHELGTGEKAISRETLDVLLLYKWEGNVRELENVIKRALVLTTGNTITPDALDKQLCREKSEAVDLSVTDFVRSFLKGRSKEGEVYNAVISEIERKLFDTALKEHNWNQLKTAKHLGVNRNTLARKVKEYGIKNI